MLYLTSLLAMAGLASASAISCRGMTPDSAGYIQPKVGTASTTQFNIGSELGGGTSCGAVALADGSKAGGSPGSGSGFLYAAINQLAFGANPGGGAGGPGGLCGQCVQITPVSASGQDLTANALTFMIVDECPVSSSGGKNCNQCTATDKNTFGQTFHFDIASDAMNSQQHSQFYAGVTDGQDWKEVKFQMAACQATSAKPHVNNWGCVTGCSNNLQASVCAT